jgi:hypothetical protein
VVGDVDGVGQGHDACEPDIEQEGGVLVVLCWSVACVCVRVGLGVRGWGSSFAGLGVNRSMTDTGARWRNTNNGREHNEKEEDEEDAPQRQSSPGCHP